MPLSRWRSRFRLFNLNLDGLSLDPEALDAALASPLRGERHDAALRQAQEAGIRAVPSVAVGNRLFSGMPQPEDLRAEILRRTS